MNKNAAKVILELRSVVVTRLRIVRFPGCRGLWSFHLRQRSRREAAQLLSVPSPLLHTTVSARSSWLSTKQGRSVKASLQLRTFISRTSIRLPLSTLGLVLIGPTSRLTFGLVIVGFIFPSSDFLNPILGHLKPLVFSCTVCKIFSKNATVKREKPVKRPMLPPIAAKRSGNVVANASVSTSSMKSNDS